MGVYKPKTTLYCEICGVSSDEKEVLYSRKYKMVLCSKHRHHMDRHGHILSRTSMDSNDYVLHDNYAEIILRNKNSEEVGRTLIDIEDIEKCKLCTWRLTYGIPKKGGLPNVSSRMKGEKSKSVSLSRYIMNYDGPLQVDHINRNRLDNRKENLRIVDGYTNMANNSITEARYASNGYIAEIRRKNIIYYMGRFKNKNEATKLRQQAVKDYNTDPENFSNMPYIKAIRNYNRKLA